MEEDVKKEEENVAPVATPPQPIKSKKGGKKTLVVFLIIILLGLGIFFVVRGLSSPSEPSPSPEVSFTSTPSPTESAEPVDKAEVSIEILNGTGIAGEAGFLQGKLEDLGYEKIEVGNAESQDAEVTKATFSSSLPQSIVDEITQTLEDIYESVDVVTSRSQDVDVSIITGLRKGQTPKPTNTATPEASPTASPSPSPTQSPESTP